VDNPASAARWLLAGLGLAATVVLGQYYGYLRAAVGVLMFGAILIIGGRFVHQMVISPPEPELQDVTEQGLKYVCEVCGLEVRVEKASHDRPPRHCGETMTLVREGGAPPLKPL
jgi:hypothetical protein